MNYLKKLFRFLLSVLFLILLSPFSVNAEISRGLMIHYLPTIDSASQRVNKINVNQIVDQVKAVGAQYLIFTLGQNKGQYIENSLALVNICPFYRYRQIDTKLIEELSEQLKRKGLQLFFYLPFRAPQFDKEMMACLGDTPERTPTNSVFVKNWSRVIEEWSLKYGTNLGGWWLDGTYNTSGMTNTDWNSLCTALYAGNSNRFIAFNSGEGLDNLNKKSSPCQNLSAGEMNSIEPLVNNGFKFVNTMRPHVLTRITKTWGGNTDPQFDCAALLKVTNYLESNNGMITVDLRYNEDTGFVQSQTKLISDAWLKKCGG